MFLRQTVCAWQFWDMWIGMGDPNTQMDRNRRSLFIIVEYLQCAYYAMNEHVCFTKVKQQNQIRQHTLKAEFTNMRFSGFLRQLQYRRDVLGQ